MSDVLVSQTRRPEDRYISFSTGKGLVLTIQSDGKIIRGEGFDSDHAASVAFMEVLSTYFECFIFGLRVRAERAEAELAKFKETEAMDRGR